MSYLPNISTGNTLWVDATNGDNSTGLRGKGDKPFLTIEAAITASIAGDLVSVRPGTYPEEGLNISGISLISTGQWEHTIIGPAPAVITQDVITIGDEGYLQGFSINVPSGAFNAINCNQASGTNSIYDVAFYGSGVLAGLGTALNREGGGKTIGGNIRVEGGGMLNALRVDSGVLALEGIHVPQSGGAITNVLLCTVNAGQTTGGRAQMIGFNSGSTNVTNGIRIEGGVSGLTFNPTALIFTANIFNCTNALSTDGVYLIANLLGGRIENVTYAVSVDIGATGVGIEDSTYRLTCNHQPNYFYNPEVANKAEFSLNFTQERTDTFDSSFNIFGADQLSVGFSEKGTESHFGKGAPFTTGMVVLNATDCVLANTATDITDITVDALSKDGSSFGFQTAVANNGIYIGSFRKDGFGNPLPFYGFELSTITGALGNVGDYIIETWDGTGWKTINAMSTSSEEGYPYGINHFLRSDSQEFVRAGITNTAFYEPTGSYGIIENSNWQSVSVTPTAGPLSGFAINSYWLRIKTIVPEGGGVTYPTFEQFKITDSSFNVSKNGIPYGTGLGMFVKTISLSGRLWSSNIAGMGVVDLENYAKVVGNTTGDNWTHEINFSQMTESDEINIQFPIPIGTCTAYPIKIKCVLNFEESQNNLTDLASDPVTLTINTLPQTSSNNFVADPSGGKTLVRRNFSVANELSASGSRDPLVVVKTINGSTVPTVIEGAIGTTLWSDLENLTHEIELCEIDVSSLYENDVILLNVNYTDDPTNGDLLITPFTLIVEGVFHQDGAGI